MKTELIEIRQDMPGFNGFIGSWVCQGDINIVIDTGPARTAGRLIESLVSRGIERVDYVLITHIHLDHVGGLADLLNHYPMARVICHEKALKHLVDPSKLWAGSLKVLRETAEAYGPPGPVLEERLIPHTENTLKDLVILETPGHAVHHLSFVLGDRLFPGEAGGNYCVIGNEELLRPATPPRFFLDVNLKSIELLLTVEDRPICFSHFGQAESSHRLLEMSRNQLLRWRDIIHGIVSGGTEDDKDLVDRCMAALLEKDPNLMALSRMKPDRQKRERYFLANSVMGFIGYFQKNA